MPYMLTLSSAGLGSNPVTSWTINWGDDNGSDSQTISTSPLPSVVPHVYGDPGTYNIKATATPQTGPAYSTTIEAQVGGQNGTAGTFDSSFPGTIPSAECYQAQASLPSGGIAVSGINSSDNPVLLSYTASGASYQTIASPAAWRRSAAWPFSLATAAPKSLPRA